MPKVIFLIVFMLVSFLSFAQIERKVTTTNQSDPVSTFYGKPEPGNNDRKQLMMELNPTREQMAKMKEIHQSGKARKEAIINDDKLTNADKQEKLKAFRKEQFQSTIDILNEEQKQKMRNNTGNRRVNNKKSR